MVIFFSEIGLFAIFFGEIVRAFFRHGVRMKRVLEQMYVVGWKSLGTTVFVGMFVGAILAIQINAQVRDFGAQSYLGGLATSVTIRNVGPVLIAFLLSGKVGAFTAAELGSMQVTDQLSAVRCLGANPIEFIVLPRMVAVVISSFLLLIAGLMMSVCGGIIAADLLGVNALNYIQQIPLIVTPWSVGVGFAKSLVFGFLLALIACRKGYTAEGGAEGVGNCVR